MEANKPVLEDGYLNSLSEIITMHNDLIDYGRIHKIYGDALEFVPCRTDTELPQLYFGTPVKINVYNSKMGFKVLAGTVVRSQEALLKVASAEMLVTSDRRQFLRIKTSATGHVWVLGDDMNPDLTAPPVRVHVEDLSLSGLQFSSPALFGLRTNLLVKLTLFDMPLALLCNIQRIVKGGGGGYSYYYGSQYLRLTQDQEETLHKVLLRLQQSRRARHNR